MRDENVLLNHSRVDIQLTGGMMELPGSMKAGTCLLIFWTVLNLTLWSHNQRYGDNPYRMTTENSISPSHKTQ